MRNKLKMFICIFIFACVTMLPASYAGAKRITLDTGSVPIVYDGAGVLTDYEKVNILSELTGLSNEDQYIYAVIITPDVNDYTMGQELEDIYNDHKSAFAGSGVVLFLINTDESNPFCELQGYRDAASFIPHEICDYVNDDLKGYVMDGEYYATVTHMIEDLKKVKNNEITSDSVTGIKQSSISYILMDRLPLMLLVLFLSLAVSAAVTVLSVISVRRKDAGRTGKTPQGIPTAGKAQKSMQDITIAAEDIYVRSVINHYGKD